MKRIILIFLCISEISCGYQAPPERTDQDKLRDYRCQSFGGFSQDVCMASVFRIAANPTTYENRIIGISGYVEEIDGNYYIFPYKAFSESNDVSNSLVCYTALSKGCELLKEYAGQNVSVLGRFSDKVSFGDWTISPIGSLDVLKVIPH